MIMRIRQKHPIKDRIKLIGILLILLIVLKSLAQMVHDSGRPEKSSTIEAFLKIALEPVGSTMYIWGGGWNEADKEGGGTATKLGLCEQWEAFMLKQNEQYDFEKHRYERENGLDCSGYVGWVLYNTFEKQNGRPGYVTLSTDMAESLAERGWGKLVKNPREFLPGDIVSMEGHVWICLGACQDDSVLLVHSSPPGVSMCGTSLNQKGNSISQESLAVTFATEYMREYHLQWQEKYPDREVPLSYLENVTVFRWSDFVMEDAKELQNLSAEEIIGILSPDM